MQTLVTDTLTVGDLLESDCRPTVTCDDCGRVGYPDKPKMALRFGVGYRLADGAAFLCAHCGSTRTRFSATG